MQKVREAESLALVRQKAGFLPGCAHQAFGIVAWMRSHALSQPLLFYLDWNEKNLPAKPKGHHCICFAELLSKQSSTYFPISMMSENPQCFSLESMMQTAQPGRLSRKWSSDTDKNCFRNNAVWHPAEVRMQERRRGPNQPVASCGGLRREPQ